MISSKLLLRKVFANKNPFSLLTCFSFSFEFWWYLIMIIQIKFHHDFDDTNTGCVCDRSFFFLNQHENKEPQNNLSWYLLISGYKKSTLSCPVLLSPNLSLQREGRREKENFVCLVHQPSFSFLNGGPIVSPVLWIVFRSMNNQRSCT